MIISYLTNELFLHITVNFNKASLSSFADAFEYKQSCFTF